MMMSEHRAGTVRTEANEIKCLTPSHLSGTSFHPFLTFSRQNGRIASAGANPLNILLISSL